VRSLLLRTASRLFQPLLLLFSVFLLLSGHNEPGGGFVGGLTAAAAFSLHMLAYGVAECRKVLRVDPRTLIGLGLLSALGSGLPPLLSGRPFLTAGWGYVQVPLLGKFEVGTPLIFDVGVYLVVLGVALTVILNLAEE
jgi:multicomponent Na+:H+ antiporter subunit B